MTRAHDVGVLVHHDDRARTEHRSGLADLAGFEREVEMFLEEPGRRCTTGDERLQLLPIADTTAVNRRFDEIAERRHAELDFVYAGLVDVTGHREHAHALARLGAERSECFATVLRD